MSQRIRLAMQKSGRLSERSRDLLNRAGIGVEIRGGQLYCQAASFPLDIMLVRDDDIPQYVADGVCDLGIVGSNMISERLDARGLRGKVVTLRPLEFGRCRLSIAAPANSSMQNLSDLRGKRIATSYPDSLKAFLADQGIAADVVEISGSVEVAPAMGVAEAICDLVSSGGTLAANQLREIAVVYTSEAVLVRTAKPISSELMTAIERLAARISGVIRAEQAKYIMMNAPASAVDSIRRVIPGLEEPTVVPLHGNKQMVAIHAVAPEPIFWETMEALKLAGASSILVVPIEKIIE
ncbi:MAG: phosphoribosyltransferase [Pseudomonadota bacterium]|jgi:ATP phosphoribosyltransferase